MANINLCILWVLVILSYDKALPAAHKLHTTRSMLRKSAARRFRRPQLQYAREHAEMKAAEHNDQKDQALIGKFANSYGMQQGAKPNKIRKPPSESPYEPYWIGGEWVYYRTTPVLKKKSATDPPRTTSGSTTPSTTTLYPESSRTTQYINYMCQHPCLGIYEDFGIVCGERYNGIWYEQKQFEDACDLISANCIDPTITKFPRDWANRWKWYRGPWYILYRGPCWNLTTPWAYPPTDLTALLSRDIYYVSKVHYNKMNSVYDL